MVDEAALRAAHLPPRIPKHTTERSEAGPLSSLNRSFQGVSTMTTPRKILAAGASLTLVAIAAGTIVWGDSSGTRPKKASPLTNAIKSTGDIGVAPQGITADRFAHTP